MPRINSPAELEEIRKGVLSKRNPDKPFLAIYDGTGCIGLGNDSVISALEKEIKKQDLQNKVDVKKTGCPEFGEKGPIVIIYPEGICYLGVTPEDAPEIISQTVVGKKVIDRLLYTDPHTGEKIVHQQEIPFYKNQLPLLIGDNNKIDPKSIDDYLAIGGYSALVNALLNMSPEQVIAEIKQSNLRGRSGGGFPAGIKWEACRNAEAETKYIICNCHEGDPGAFVDRRMMEGNPHSILEGMIIGAYAIGANEGYVFVGDEFPLTVENTQTAIKQAEEYGLLGKNILGCGFDLNIRISIDGGGYVCGESTALMASMEGRVGEPITKYDHATERGLWASPTDLNNLQTWANVPLIINRGADWYGKIGTSRSKGTRVFSLAGMINNSGLVEVPMGTTFRKIVFDIGGGIPGDKKFKAVQVGGPLGGFVPESMLDLPVDFEELTKVGLTMGPGLIVTAENTCIVDMVKYFLKFLSNESCGKCTPCREGLRQMIKILNNITEGKGKKGDIALLEMIAAAQQGAALCALGKGAANPLLSSLKYFRDEYEAHIEQKRCPALVCKELISSTPS
ncbi:MAG: NADH-quinone oxidoreductase subunit F [Syntrophales bacterium]|jgi:NADH-quinone oxidoreductase subunit F|nr:NADH-quinone oxidoreductase subunit F [Syntrophales bacterium]